MDDSRNGSAAGLLATLVTSVIPDPTSIPYYLPSAYKVLSLLASEQGQSPGGEDGGNGGGGGGKMREWSSLIGIVTALVGNIFISFALNIQRYAHIRIEREWESERLRLGVRRRPRWRQDNSDGTLSTNYGTVPSLDEENSADERRSRGHSGSPNFESYRDEPEEVTNGVDRNGRDGNGRLEQSFESDQTLKPVEKDLNGHDRKSYLRSPYWWAGIVLMTIGEAGNFLAYGFAPASIVSPLGVVALVSNCVIAPFMLKEKFRKQDFWGVLVAVAGAVVVVLSAKTSETTIGPHEIWLMITRWEFELYLGLTAALIAALMWASGKYGSRTILIDLGLVGLFGGYTALSTKGVASLFSFTLWHVITFPVTYLLVAVLVFSALMQIRYINRALRRFDSTQVIPTQFVLFTLSVIIGSAILYRDFESTTAAQAAKFVGGCAMTFLGVYLITSGRVRADDESSISIDDEEEAIGLLDGERYQDRIDLSPPGQDRRVYKPGQTAVEEQDIPRSPRGSFLSGSININDDELHAPRGALSVSPSSQAGSLTAESLSSRETTASPPPPQSLTTNAWAASQQHLVDTTQSVPPIRPSTPPGQTSNTPTASTVLLRFPSAPGIIDLPRQNGETPRTPGPPSPRTNTAHRISRHPPGMHTPPPSVRNSLSLRFTPGPLLAPLSSSLSALVAESLRRGEGSPGKTHRAKGKGKRKHSDAAVDDAHRNGDGEAAEIEYETEVSVDDDHHHSSGAILSTPASKRFHSTGNMPTATSTAGHSTPANADTGSKDVVEGATLTRLRSLSDSWNDGLAWLGGTLRKSNKRRRKGLLPSPQLDHGNGEEGDADRE